VYRLHAGQVVQSLALTPPGKPAGGFVVCPLRVLVADIGREEIEEPLRRGSIRKKYGGVLCPECRQAARDVDGNDSAAGLLFRQHFPVAIDCCSDVAIEAFKVPPINIFEMPFTRVNVYSTPPVAARN